jgi:hypothetical protein
LEPSLPGVESFGAILLSEIALIRHGLQDVLVGPEVPVGSRLENWAHEGLKVRDSHFRSFS